MLRHFEDEAVAAIVCFKRVENFRQMPVEFHVDDSADDLCHVAGRHVGRGVGQSSFP